ncbi:MAG: glycosyltransferase family 39 protein [Chloroflexi bacterium]|nr:glycosyltransferase family 39 protein [Chloroflexota bacterium]
MIPTAVDRQAPEPAWAYPSRRAAAATRLLLAGLCLLAFALRAHRLAAQSLWSDEDITLDRAGLPLRELLAGLPVEQAPGYYVLMHAWTRLAGDSDLALRYPSLLAGVLAVPLAAYVGCRLRDRHTGMLLALVTALNPFLVYYGQEARMYALLYGLALAAIACLLRGIDSGRLRWWAACGALVAGILYTHYYGALIVFGLAGWAGFDLLARDRAQLRGWLVAGLVAALLFGPWLPRAIGVLGFGGWRGDLLLAGAARTHLGQWFAGRSAPAIGPGTWLYGLAALTGLAISAVVTAIESAWPGLRDAEGRRFHSARAGMALELLPLLAYALVVLRTADLESGWRTASADYDPRYALAALPGLYLQAATGFALLGNLILWPLSGLLRRLPGTGSGPGRRLLESDAQGPALLGPLLAGALIGAAAVPGLRNLYTDPAWQKQDYRGFVATVEAAAGHEDTVLLLDGPNYGLTRRYEVDDSPVKIVNLHSSGNLERGPEARAAYLAELAGSYPHLWLAEDGAALGEAKAWLDAGTYPVSEAGYQDITLRRYYRPVLAARDPGMLADPSRSAIRAGTAPVRQDLLLLVTEDAMHGSGARFADGPVRCQGATLRSLAAGEILPVFLTWSTETALTQRLKVSLRLLPEDAWMRGDPQGPAILDSDREPANWTRPSRDWAPGEPVVDRHALVLPRDMPPGRYALEVVLYDAETLVEVGHWWAPSLRVEPAR